MDLCIPVKNAQDVGEVLAFIDIGVSYHAKSKCRSQSLSEWNENNLEAETQREKLVIVKNDRNLCQKIAASEKTFFHASEVDLLFNYFSALSGVLFVYLLVSRVMLNVNMRSTQYSHSSLL